VDRLDAERGEGGGSVKGGDAQNDGVTSEAEAQRGQAIREALRNMQANNEARAAQGPPAWAAPPPAQGDAYQQALQLQQAHKQAAPAPVAPPPMQTAPAQPPPQKRPEEEQQMSAGLLPEWMR
jgi:hypothetical protein